MSHQGSPPFSLTAHDWKKIGVGAVLSVSGALATYIGAHVLPELEKHIANDVGLMIYTVIAALAPVIFNIGRKLLTDTATVVKLLLIGFVLTLALPGVACAQEVATALPTWLPQFDFSTWVAIAGVVVLGFINRDKLSTILRKLADVIDRNGPAPQPSPAPTPNPSPVVTTLPELIQLLINQFFQFRALGNQEGEAKVKALLDEALKTNV